MKKETTYHKKGPAAAMQLDRVRARRAVSRLRGSDGQGNACGDAR